MRLGLLASFFVVLATASNTTGGGTTSIPLSGAGGAWSRAAGLATGREGHTATLLLSGKVLIAGGTDGRGKVLASAELYDPVRDRWTSAGSMAETRIGHTATLLPNGKVLVAGGLVMPFPAPSIASSELYDPATNRWSIAAPMIESRTRHTATLLPDGRVLVVGGLNVTLHDGGLFPSQPRDAEIYDLTANRWSATAPIEFRRLGQTATQLPDGRVFVAGGQDDSGTFLKSTEIYDAAQDRWISAAPMAAARFGHVATLLPGGDVLVAGGLGEENLALTSAEVYDPRTNLWVTVASMAEVLSAGTATLLRTGLVLVVGGTGQSGAELYDLADDRWSRTGPLMDRYQPSATRLFDGRVLIVGGYGVDAFNSAMVYDPTAVAPVPVRPPDSRTIAALLLTALLVVAATGWSVPSIRQRLQRWRPPRESEEWIA
ncbi:MAG TPA: kelch repeat-containing protein [Candidatus Dormibacteraeota bacterium]